MPKSAPTRRSPGAHGRKARAAARTRALGAIGVLTLLAAGLAGCNLLPATPEPPTATAEPEIAASPTPTDALPPGLTKLVFWEPFALDRPQGLLLGEMVRDFEAQNADVTVEIVPKSGYTGIHGAMQAGLLGEELPDLAVAFPSMIAEYAAAGAVAPLDAHLYDPEVGLGAEGLADFPPGLLEAGRFPGFGQQLLAFPFAQNAVGMWVNDSLLAQAGWDHAPVTWPEFEQACWDVITLTGSGCYPFVESVSTFNAWLLSRGGRQLDESGRQATFNSPAGVDSLALLRRMMEMGLAWRPQEQYGDYVAFANGEAAFTFSSTGNNLLYSEAYAAALQNGVPAFRWRQTMIPQADPQNPATTLYGSSFFVVRSDPERERAAWRFIRWFTDRDQTARWASGLETVPARFSALEVMTDTLEAYPFVRAQVQEILPYARPEPSIPAELAVRDILYTAILSVTQAYADPQTVLDQAAREANAVLAGGP